MPGEPPAPPVQPNPPADPNRPDQPSPPAEPNRPDQPNPPAEPNRRDQPSPLGEPERSGQPDPAQLARRRRRLAEVFGAVLPETTGDDRPDDGTPGSADERWYTENRPPHHEPP
jgi:hypothetical protein